MDRKGSWSVPKVSAERGLNIETEAKSIWLQMLQFAFVIDFQIPVYGKIKTENDLF